MCSKKYFAFFMLLVSVVKCQRMPVFIGPNTPPVPGPQVRAPPNRGSFPVQFGGPNTVPTIPERPPAPQSQAFNQPNQETERWAPGEPQWFFPSSRRQWMGSCQRLGCSGIGVHCVFWGGLCPASVRRVPCRCQRGCRVDTHYIPFGQRRIIDRCNNVCVCDSREGIARCTSIRC